MKLSRYNELEGGAKPKLTEEEKQGGWHFCSDWDSMLIHSTWDEYSCCTCNIK